MPFGSIYTRKAQTKVHRHGFDTTLSIASGKAEKLSLLAYSTVAQSPIAGTDSQYNTLVVPDGSKVNKYWLDMTIEPSSNTKVYDLYIGWIALSMDEILSIPDTQISLSKGTNDAITGSTEDFAMSTFRLNPKNRPFVKGMKKLTLYAGKPAQVSRWLKVPRKCSRSQEGMYWGLYIANATTDTSGTTDGTVNIKVSRVFNEFPLVD